MKLRFVEYTHDPGRWFIPAAGRQTLCERSREDNGPLDQLDGCGKRKWDESCEPTLRSSKPRSDI